MRVVRWIKSPYLQGALFSVAYLVTRFFNIRVLPIVTDEAIYLRWAQVIARDSGQLFLPLTDGKTPLFMWSVIPFLALIEDPLLAGRIFAVLLGLVGLIGVWIFTTLLFGTRAAWFAALFWTVIPYVYTYDRLALVESLLLACHIWFLVMLVLFIQRRSLLYAGLTGLFWGAAFLAKPSALTLAISIALLLSTTNVRYKLRRLVGGLAVLMTIAVLTAATVKVSPSFRSIFTRTAEYTFTPYEFLKRPYEIISGNSSSLAEWFVGNVTWPIVLWMGVGTIVAFRRSPRAGLALLGIGGLTIGVLIVTGKVLYPRYLLGVLPVLVPLAGLGGASVVVGRRAMFALALVVASLLPAIMFDTRLALAPETAPFAHVDRWQYVSSWASGHGIYQYAQFLRKQAKDQNVVVGAEGRFGNPYNGLEVYLDRVRGVSIIPVDHDLARIPPALRQTGVRTYLIANQSRLQLPPEAPVEKIEFVPKPRLDNKTPQDGLWLLRIKEER